MQAQLNEGGFLVLPKLVSTGECDDLIARLEALSATGAGSREMLRFSWCSVFAARLQADAILREVLPVNGVAVQCTLFDKSPSKNWLVALHQDLSIPVKRRIESPECSGWSEKEGRLYVQPPVYVLEQLIAMRIHVDDCPLESGPLRVVPRSHAFGRLDRTRAEALRTEKGEVAVPVSRAGALVMRPLLLHTSSKATEPSPRRVLHFVFGPRILPLGLGWGKAVSC